MNTPDLTSLVRAHIRDLTPYASARDEYNGEAAVFLDANENPLGSATDEDFNRYPDPLQKSVKARIADIKGIAPDHIFLGNGSDEAIDLLYRAFVEPGREHVMLTPPTYGMYQVSADIHKVRTVSVPLKDDYQLSVAEMVAAMRPGTKLTFICSPNNPTGNAMQRSDIARILKFARGLVVVDEAYIDFCPEKSLLSLIAEYPHLVVLQTFSKAWGMAGLRLGMAFAHPFIIETLNKIKPPYNINILTQQKALEALEQAEKKDTMVKQMLQNRETLIKGLAEVEIVDEIFPSDANFALCRVDNATIRYQQLIEKEVIVRNRSRVTLCDNCLRISVGTEAEQIELLQALESLPTLDIIPDSSSL